jgi:hypothetical protein
MQSLFETYGQDTIKTHLFVVFGGLNKKALGIPPFEFLNSLTSWFPRIDKKFYIDIHQCWYQKGIHGFSTNVEETVVYLKKVIKPYKRVVFIGTSAGGYAAILFGSLLNVDKVVAFVPQTIVKNHSAKFNDLKKVINKQTSYHVYGDSSVTDVNDLHHISHVNNLREFSNVRLSFKNGVNLKEMRHNGELQHFLKSLF